MPPENTAYTASDLPITPSGRIYHLNLLPEELARNILIVGDPERVPLIAKAFFERIEADVSHRGLRTITGRVAETNLHVSVVTSGMGTPSFEIVFQELIALNEIDFATRRRNPVFEPLHIIRLGTSGGLQQETALGTAIVTRYALGMDNTGLFYDAPPADEHCTQLETRVAAALLQHTPSDRRFRGVIQPYAAAADSGMVQALEDSAQALGVVFKTGITVSSSGFFANQGRDVTRVAPTVPDIDALFGALDPGIDGLRFENMEMEASILLHLAQGLGYRAGAICPAIANRRSNTFATDYAQNVKDATAVALRALQRLDGR